MFPGLYPFRKRNTLKKALFGLMAVFAVSASHADPYVVASLGSSKLDLDCAGTTSCDTRGTGLKLLGGYKFTPNFAIEGGYLDFGKAKASDSTGSVTLKAYGPAIGAAFHQDINSDWNMVARLGLASMKAEIGDSGVSLGTTSTQLYGGLGVGYRITPKVSIDGSFDFSKAELLGEKFNTNMFGIGVTVAF